MKAADPGIATRLSSQRSSARGRDLPGAGRNPTGRPRSGKIRNLFAQALSHMTVHKRHLTHRANRTLSIDTEEHEPHLYTVVDAR